jgi:hypothetical protein
MVFSRIGCAQKHAKSTTGKGPTVSRAAKALQPSAALAAVGRMRRRTMRTVILFVCALALVSTCVRAQAAGGPIRLQDCKWVFVVIDYYGLRITSVATPDGFVRTQGNIDPSRLSKGFSLKGLENYFQKAGDVGTDLPPNKLYWDPVSAASHDQTPLPRLQCPYWGPTI